MNVCVKNIQVSVKNIQGFRVAFQLTFQVALRQKYCQTRKVLPLKNGLDG